jgi:hypothetical protein
MTHTVALTFGKYNLPNAYLQVWASPETCKNRVDEHLLERGEHLPEQGLQQPRRYAKHLAEHGNT